MRHFLLRIVSNPYLMLATASLCWSMNHIVGRAAAGHVPPVGLSFARWLFPAAILYLLARPHLTRDWTLMIRHWRIVVLLGFLGGTVFGVIQYVGLKYTTALNTSVLNSVAPVLIVAAGALIFRDKLVKHQLIGITTSLIGVLVIVTRADLQALAALAFNWGDLLILSNQAVFAIYAACLRLHPQVHWLSAMFMLSLVATVTTLPMFVWEQASGATFEPTLLTLVAIIYVAIFPSVIGFASWNRGVELIGANRAGAFLHLIPLYSSVLASAVLGEKLMAYHVLGFFLIIGGVWLAARKA